MDCITSEEAAEILGISKRQLHRLTREGHLKARLKGKAYVYDPNGVYALKDIRESGMTLIEAVARATRAELTANRLERQFNQLCSILGVNVLSADTTPEAVVALHRRVQDALSCAAEPSLGDVMFWAKTFLSISEEYLHVVSKQFLTDKPWSCYVELSNKLIQLTQWKLVKQDPELNIAYKLLDLGRRGFRQALFSYALSTSNRRLAYKLVPEALGDVHEDVLMMASLIVD